MTSAHILPCIPVISWNAMQNWCDFSSHFNVNAYRRRKNKEHTVQSVVYHFSLCYTHIHMHTNAPSVSFLIGSISFTALYWMSKCHVTCTQAYEYSKNIAVLTLQIIIGDLVDLRLSQTNTHISFHILKSAGCRLDFSVFIVTAQIYCFVFSG